MPSSGYQGYLIKIGNYTIPLSKIKADDYSAYYNMQDFEPWTDNSGYLHRDPVELKALKVEFSTRNMMDNTEFSDLIANIQAQMTKPQGRECYITAYIPEINDYVTQLGYMADYQPTMYLADSNKILYNSCRFAFIGGVYSGD